MLRCAVSASARDQRLIEVDQIVSAVGIEHPLARCCCST
jgi:hypothetical protein